MNPRLSFRRLARLFSILGVVLSWPSLRASDLPKFDGGPLPVPPQQSRPWTAAVDWTAPDDTLPADAQAAVDRLFEQGFPDPRGCDYREISLVIGSCWGGEGIVQTHGWVIPDSDRPRFAIAWSGLIYPLVSTGPAADLRADVLTMLARDGAQVDEKRASNERVEKQDRATAKRQGTEYHAFPRTARMQGWVASEGSAVASTVIRPIKAALLLRAGETELAAKLWEQWFSAVRPFDEPPYRTLAQEWVWELFDRAVCAHMRGDDRLVLASAGVLTAIQPGVEAEFTRENATGPRVRQADAPLYYLKALPDLVADAQRRLGEPAYAPVLEMDHPPQGKERITGLIRDLELVSARQNMQPGGVILAEDPVVKALIDAGSNAVEPLLDCLENDTRLTRSVSYGRDFSTGRTLLGVAEAAFAALANICQTDFLHVNSSVPETLNAHNADGRRETAAAIRAYWEMNRTFTVAERWYETLRDDQAGPERWLGAADNIVQDANLEILRNGNSGNTLTTTWYTSPATTPPALRGEALRAKTDPTVAELLVNRLASVGESAGDKPDRRLRSTARLALALAKWDGPGNLEPLHALSETLRATFVPGNASREYLVTDILALYQARLQAGDTARTLAEYADWLPAVSRKDLSFSAEATFKIMYQHPAEPVIQRLAETVFSAPDSAWAPLIQQERNTIVTDLFRSPLVGLAAFRADVLRGLADSAAAGSVTIDPKGQTMLSVDGGWRGGWDNAAGDPLAPAGDAPVAFRVCDLLASEISRLDGAPKFALYWPEKDRDAAVAACAEFLQRYGDLFQYKIGDRLDAMRLVSPPIHFPVLDHPATAEDVEQKRAIFSLTGGERRLAKLPAFPLAAEWTTLTDDPYVAKTFGRDGTWTEHHGYRNAGRIFQAEEVLVDGQWERYYGFVGAHRIARAPAGEVEFPTPYASRLSHGFDCEFTAPRGRAILFGRDAKPFTPADALPVTVKIRNRAGLDQPAPGAVRLPPDAHRTVPRAVEVRLSFVEKPAGNLSLPPESAWQPVPMKSGVTVAEPASGEPVGLAPTEELTLLTADLRDLFDFTRPGIYRVEVVFNAPGEIEGKSLPEEFEVRAAAK